MSSERVRTRRRRALNVSRRHLALGGALVGVLAGASPGWTGATWASANAGHEHPAHNPMAKLGPLSGKWSGKYSGSFTGTFNLAWQEHGNTLSGTIRISAFGNAPTSIHGSVKGASIKFGTVGSKAITYSGSASPSTMSGTWTIRAGGRSLGGGSWTARRD